MELSNPYVLLMRGKEYARMNYGTEGRGGSKKRMPDFNGQDRG